MSVDEQYTNTHKSYWPSSPIFHIVGVIIMFVHQFVALSILAIVTVDSLDISPRMSKGRVVAWPSRSMILSYSQF